VTTYLMADDRIVGDGGGVTIYMRPDGSRYALDRGGRGHELCFGEAPGGRPGSIRESWPTAAGPARGLTSATRRSSDREGVSVGEGRPLSSGSPGWPPGKRFRRTR
jgi:hypothetical protein